MSQEMINLEKEIDELDEIKEWGKKIEKMKEIKEKIKEQKIKIEKLLETINSGEVKKSKKDKDLSFDELLKKIETCNNVDEKIKIFNQIQVFIKDNELELFE
jgi:hypothetical protein